jgi:hypothetical protein
MLRHPHGYYLDSLKSTGVDVLYSRDRSELIYTHLGKHMLSHETRFITKLKPGTHQTASPQA